MVGRLLYRRLTRRLRGGWAGPTVSTECCWRYRAAETKRSTTTSTHKLFQLIGHRGGQARALNSVGRSYDKRLTTASRRSPCSQTSKTARARPPPGTVSATPTTGCYQRSLDLFRDLGDRYKEAEILAHLGDTHHAAGKPTAAYAAGQQALDIRTELGHDPQPLKSSWPYAPYPAAERTPRRMAVHRLGALVEPLGK
jgi:hypothetical protein